MHFVYERPGTEIQYECTEHKTSYDKNILHVSGKNL